MSGHSFCRKSRTCFFFQGSFLQWCTQNLTHGPMVLEKRGLHMTQLYFFTATVIVRNLGPSAQPLLQWNHWYFQSSFQENSVWQVWHIWHNQANDTICHIITTLTCGPSCAFRIVTYYSNWGGAVCYDSVSHPLEFVILRKILSFGKLGKCQLNFLKVY